MTPEGRVKAKVKKAFEKFGRSCWRFMPVQSGYGAPALDFLFALRGRFIAIETKAPGNKLTPQQESTKAAIEAAGGLVFVVWDDETLDAALAAIHLALEFDHVSQGSLTEHYQAGLDAGWPNRGTNVVAYRTNGAWAWADLEEHEGPEQPAQAPDEAAGGDHGPFGAPSQRLAVAEACRHDQRSTAEDVAHPKYCTCGASQAFPTRPHRHWCPRYGLNDGNC